MKIILKDAITDDETVLEVHKNDLVASIKAKIQEMYEKTRGRLLVLNSVSGIELEDESYLGNYEVIKPGAMIEFSLPVTQPFAPVNYSQVLKSLERTVKKKFLEDFFDPTKEDNDWVKEWNKGDEYLNYPPIDITKNNLEVEHISKDNKFREKMESYMKSLLDRGRSFHSLYLCQVSGYKFYTLHKYEGKWSGSAVHYSEKGVSNHSCSSNMAFDGRRKRWIEQQAYIGPSGLSNSRIFQYQPEGDGVCEATCDDALLLENVVLKLKEEENESLLLTGVDIKTGTIVLTESIVMTGDKRTRTITRFNSNGKFLGVIICREKKIINENTNAIATSIFS